MQVPPQSICRKYSTSPTETRYPLNNKFQFSSIPSPLATIVLFSVSVDLTVLGTSYHWNHTVSVCDWLISLSIVSSRFIHLIACVRISLLLKAKEYSVEYIYSIMDGCLGCFHLLLLLITLLENGCSNIYLSPHFQFYTQRWNCWII